MELLTRSKKDMIEKKTYDLGQGDVTVKIREENTLKLKKLCSQKGYNSDRLRSTSSNRKKQSYCIILPLYPEVLEIYSLTRLAT